VKRERSARRQRGKREETAIRYKSLYGGVGGIGGHLPPGRYLMRPTCTHQGCQKKAEFKKSASKRMSWAKRKKEAERYGFAANSIMR